MTYSKFIEKTSKYLHSVRVLKNYVSFDMLFPQTWVLLKTYPEGIEVIKNENADQTTITSFVVVNEKEKVDNIEKIIDSIVKTNIEREEKEKLFKNKVLELKSIFEKQNLESLKGLKFDLEELHNFIENAEPQISNGSPTESQKA
jgi:ATP-dependent Lon protease